MPSTVEKKILKYDHRSMEKALEAVKAKQLSVKAAAKTYGVPRTTLLYKVNGRYPEERRMGPKTNLSLEEENIIIRWMFNAADTGFPITREQLLSSVELYVKKTNKKTSFNNNKPGKKWFSLFLKRHPEVSPRLSQNLNQARVAVNEQKIRNWFQEVRSSLEEENALDIFNDPARIWNLDETAIYLQPKTEKVFVRKGERAVYNFTNNDEKECVTTLITANAAGLIAPPMVVFAYERLPFAIINSLPENWHIGRSESGWMTSETFFEYVANAFHPFLIENNIKLPIVLFLDGHSSHLTYTLSKFCNDHGIILVALLPNATHILQPLDVAVFRPLKQKWKRSVQLWKMKNNGGKLKREDFAPLLGTVLQELNATIFINGFRACGLCPFNEDAVNYEKFFKGISEKKNDNSEISTEMIKIHLKFLEREIGNVKLKKFERNEYDIEDKSLYSMWKKLHSRVQVSVEQKVTDCISNKTQGFEIVKDIIEDMISIVENTIASKNTRENITHLSPIKNQINKDDSEDVASFIPSPFKGILFWPKSQHKKNTKNRKERIPSVVSGSKGREYFLKKEKQKEQIEKEKTERKLLREQKRKIREAKSGCSTLKRRKTHQQISESSSESEGMEIVMDSEGEGDNWDRHSISESDEREEIFPEVNVNKIIAGNFVIVRYDNNYFPGKVLQVDNGSFLVSAMSPSGFNFKWPPKPDEIWYGTEDILMKIGEPIKFNSRGSFRVPEMCRFQTMELAK